MVSSFVFSQLLLFAIKYIFHMEFNLGTQHTGQSRFLLSGCHLVPHILSSAVFPFFYHVRWNMQNSLHARLSLDLLR